MRSRLWGAWLAFGLVGTAQAQTPQGTGFTYQGGLSDAGLPADGAYDFRFALFDALTGGVPVGPSLVREDVAVANGLFTVVLDFGAVFGNSRRFLEVAVRPGASTGAFVPLTPRQDLTATPNALASAATPWGGVTGKPAGFADDVDNDSGGTVSSVAAGSGLSGGPITTTGALAVAFAGTGSAATVARSDHQHDTAYVRNQTTTQAGVSFNVGGTGTAGVLSAATQFNLGADRILASPGTSNLFAGVGAGASQTTGAANSYFGANAGGANATGGSNSLFGFNAGRSTTGSNNSFFGDAAGFSNTTGGSAFFGFLAGFSNTTGSGNAFFGREAGRANVTGNGNSFFGDQAGLSNTTSINNAFFGRAAGIANTTGAVNSFFGEGAGRNNTTGGGNVFVGREAGFANTTGSRNVFIGSATPLANVTGNDLTVVGTFANVAVDGLSFATALGAGAIVTASNTLVLGRPADAVRVPGSLGVNGTLSAGTLDVTGAVTAGSVTATGVVSASAVDAVTQFSLGGERLLTDMGNQNVFVGIATGPAIENGSFNTFVGHGAGFMTTTGNSNTFVGQGAGLVNTNGSSNTFIGSSASATIPVSNSIAIGAGVQVGASNTILLGKANHATLIPGVMRVSDIGLGNFGLQVVNSAIGGGVVAHNLYIRQLNQPGSPSHLCWRASSDGIQALILTTCTTPFAGATDQLEPRPFTSGLDVVRRLEPVRFRWKDGGAHDIGLTADDVAAVEPLLVAMGDDGRAQHVKTEQLIAVLLSAVKEQLAEIEALRRVVCASRPGDAPCAATPR
jgi:hypothetical protein